MLIFYRVTSIARSLPTSFSSRSSSIPPNSALYPPNRDCAPPPPILFLVPYSFTLRHHRFETLPLQNEPFLRAPGSLPASTPRTRNETEGSPAPPSSPSPLPPVHPLSSRGRVSEPRHGNHPTFSPLFPHNILHLLPITNVIPSYHLLPPSPSYPNPKKPTHPLPPSHFSSLVSTPLSSSLFTLPLRAPALPLKHKHFLHYISAPHLVRIISLSPFPAFQLFS